MSDFVDTLVLKDTNKIKEKLDCLVEENDLVRVNLKAVNAIKNNIVVPESSLTPKKNMRDNLVKPISGFYMREKYFLLAKALIVAEDKVDNAIITKKLGYNEVDEEFAIMDYEKHLDTVLDDNRLPEDERRRNARAMCLADRFLEDKKFRDHFANPGRFSAIIDDAIKKDPKFIQKSTNPLIISTYSLSKMDYYNSIDRRYTQDMIKTAGDELFTKVEADELIAQNRELTNTKNNVENELREKQRISNMQKERDGRSIFWFIFRPISNLVNYIQLNNAKSAYKENYILPKLDKFKNDDNYEQKVENAVTKFNGDIVSDREITVDTVMPKSLTADELEQLDYDEIVAKNDDDSLFNDEVEERENFLESIKNDTLDNNMSVDNDDNFIINTDTVRKDDIQLNQ